MIEPTVRGAVRELEAKLRPFVARRVRSASDVDDIVQDVFLRMQRGLSELREPDRFGPWVYQVARSAIVDHQRTAAKHGAREVAEGEQRPFEEEEDSAIEEQLARSLSLFIATLPPPYRDALTLVELRGLTQKRAAEMLGTSLSGMKSRVQRGRAQLRHALEACCHIALDVRGHVTSCEPRPDGLQPNGCCNATAEKA